MSSRPADQIRKLVTLAASGDTPEAQSARAMARKQLGKLNTEVLSTLEGQRQALLEGLTEEHRRLISSHERATKADTGELVGRAMSLLQNQQRYGLDALIAAVMLLRIEDGHQLTPDERQQLAGPVDDFLSSWMRAGQKRRKEEREKRRAESRRARKEKA